MNDATNNTATAMILFILLNFFNSIINPLISYKTANIVKTNMYFCSKIRANNTNMANNDWKSRLGMVYSTNPDYQFEQEESCEQETLPPKEQKLIVRIDKKGRGGKQVTVVEGFVGKEEDMEALGKMLKSKCGVGGSVKDGEILVQGDQREKIVNILLSLDYKAKRGN